MFAQKQETEINNRKRSKGDQTSSVHEASRSQTIVQAQMLMTEPGDAYEQEAERMANSFLPSISRMPASHSSVTVSPELEASISSSRGGGFAMPEALKNSMEHRFGADFSDVRFHTDSEASRMSASIRAKAFTSGKDIYFGEGYYNPDSSAGQRLIVHELTHTIQQSGKVAREDVDTEVPSDEHDWSLSDAKIAKTAISTANVYFILSSWIEDLEEAHKDFKKASDSAITLQKEISELEEGLRKLQLDKKELELLLASGTKWLEDQQLKDLIERLNNNPLFKNFSNKAAVTNLNNKKNELQSFWDTIYSCNRAIKEKTSRFSLFKKMSPSNFMKTVKAIKYLGKALDIEQIAYGGYQITKHDYANGAYNMASGGASFFASKIIWPYTIYEIAHSVYSIFANWNFEIRVDINSSGAINKVFAFGPEEQITVFLTLCKKEEISIQTAIEYGIKVSVREGIGVGKRFDGIAHLGMKSIEDLDERCKESPALEKARYLRFDADKISSDMGIDYVPLKDIAELGQDINDSADDFAGEHAREFKESLLNLFDPAGGLDFYFSPMNFF